MLGFINRVCKPARGGGFDGFPWNLNAGFRFGIYCAALCVCVLRLGGTGFFWEGGGLLITLWSVLFARKVTLCHAEATLSQPVGQ